MAASGWAGPGDPVGQYVREESESTLAAYRIQPTSVDEHANQEQDTARGGYAHRQLVELIQNSADQLAKAGRGRSRINIRLTGAHLYCADDGIPIDEDGVKSLLFSHLSPKRDTVEIGRFGVGFKSVLRVSDSPAFFSRSGSFQFDREWAKSQIQAVAPNAADYPVLRVAKPIIPQHRAQADPILNDLMSWASNIVMLPLLPNTREDLADQMSDFEAEFLLFVPHVRALDLEWDERGSRSLRVVRADGETELNDSGAKSRWRIFNCLHKLSYAARHDSRALDNAAEVQIQWAAPIEDVRNAPQQFWAAFPTQISSLLSGILNAPWKTNEDRQSLLPGEYNEELIVAAAELVAEALPKLTTIENPAQHLDVLPRRQEVGDNDHAVLLRKMIYHNLRHSAVLPDQNGVLRKLEDLNLPPDTLTPGQRVEINALERWSSYSYRPANWLHSDALSSDRLAAIGRIYVSGLKDRGYPPRASLANWFESLVQAGSARNDATGASHAAVQAAAFLPDHILGMKNRQLGKITLTLAGAYMEPDSDSIFLSGDDLYTTVHPDLVSNPETLDALKTLGLRHPSPESRLHGTAAALSDVEGEDARADNRWHQFWEYSQRCSIKSALEIVGEHFASPGAVRVMTEAETWEPIREVLLPGSIVSADGSEEGYVVVDTQYHQQDMELLTAFGAVAEPRSDYQMSDAYYQGYLDRCRIFFRDMVESNPRLNLLNFDTDRSCGPLDIYQYLSIDARAEYCDTLLRLDTTFEQLIMSHDTRRELGAHHFPSPALELLRQEGYVALDDGVYPLSDGLSAQPKNPEVQRWLLQHPNSHRIRQAFDLKFDISGPVDALGDDEPTPLLDLWPGLGSAVNSEQRSLNLIRCDRIQTEDGSEIRQDCLVHEGTIYLLRCEEERAELEAVARELELTLNSDQLERILNRETRHDIAAKRDEVRGQPTNAARLLAAVGEIALRSSLPQTLVEYLRQSGKLLAGERVAEAAIATHHTDALRHHRRHLKHLDPPRQWAGRPRAVEFVRALGFSDDWAGQPNPKRAPAVDVLGPRSLPELHDYQTRAVARVKRMLSARQSGGENRGLLSMPTGSGKTRVAVQAIIEVIRDEGFSGAVLWVADRDELCEQAVEVWAQAWASVGPEAEPLRISRLWGGQARPVTPVGAHVIVATIQTLEARRKRGGLAVDFFDEVGLVVIDEAHGSIAPSYTRILEELGLTFRRSEDEICLLGLTATPYRGIDEDETRRLVNRYGQNRLDSGAFGSDDPEQVIHDLQRMTVLAEIDHRVIEGERLSLSDEELRQVRDAPWLPESAQSRLASSTARTGRIVDAYLKIAGEEHDCPTLIFATSVEHAETIAAVLKLSGVEARAVSSQTDASVRRSIVEQFRAGDIKALVNYGVFREGFDAPRTRAIIVARPVYSPNLYFQMIGRGLRGHLNGGTDRCLILDVEDNVENYEGKLAFTTLEGLWKVRGPAEIRTPR